MKVIKIISLALLMSLTALAPAIACEMHNKEQQSKVKEQHQTKHTVTKTVYETTVVQTAEATEASSITASAVWAKPNYGPNGAVYLKLNNTGKEERKLVSASSALSDKVEIHEHLHEGGVMKMRPAKTPITIPPGKSLSFAPGGLHVMMFNMKAKKKAGETYPLALIFGNGETLNLDVKVKDKASD
ncbi:MAG: hypothetical protein DHS20C08_23450 [Rhodomicrobium sp.]|nr:MAG: hypothetical protein DHS20C08_23450 [Rhodomicrobium sp.]